MHGERTVITEDPEPILSDQIIEVVERKGIGHPDTICDSLAEEASVALCRYYLSEFGAIMHHNIDKVLLVGGTSDPAFGGGRILEPIELYIAGRVTIEVEGRAVPAEELVIEACRAWLRSHLRYVDVDRSIHLHCHLRPGSGDLVGLFAHQPGEVVLANDTSCGVGFAPLTPLERLVLGVDEDVSYAPFFDAHPELGEDLKLMAVRRGDAVELTVADAFVAGYVENRDDYLRKRADFRRAVEGIVRDRGMPAAVHVNAADQPEQGNLYLTVSGTSAESGDDGEAGRGNRATGLITPYRPMTMESVAGKNPVSHVGKIYNVAAQQLAARLVEGIPGLRGAECCLVSRIGQSIAEPQLIHVRVQFAKGAHVVDFQGDIDAIVDAELAGLPALTHAFVQRRVRIV